MDVISLCIVCTTNIHAKKNTVNRLMRDRNLGVMHHALASKNGMWVHNPADARCCVLERGGLVKKSRARNLPYVPDPAVATDLAIEPVAHTGVGPTTMHRCEASPSMEHGKEMRGVSWRSSDEAGTHQREHRAMHTRGASDPSRSSSDS